ncbi:Lrp/AsnC family transcriptional regulator [Leucobacter chinensis]|uniref:Lrp/AsnC family transcriptional regulator n=1 Tax=Leucobacter chinensis TaxID=2851010 RepID=UPI003510876C
MVKQISLDDIDGKILHALQIWPRAAWSDIGRILTIDPMTASRRWARLTDAGVAWLSSYQMGQTTFALDLNPKAPLLNAVIELQVKAKFLVRTIESLKRFPELRMMRLTLGEWNVSLDWTGSRMDELERFIHDRLAQIRGIRATRSFTVVQVPIEGSSWRYDALSSEQEEAVIRLMREDLYDASPPTERWHEIDNLIADFIREDARMSFTEMAKRANTTVVRVKRHLTHLLRDRDLVIRCDLSRSYSQRPVTLRVFAQVPPNELRSAFQGLARLPEVRSCSLLVGKYNLMINAWLGSMQDVPTFEARLAQDIPQLTVTERDIVVRLIRHGWVDMNERGLKNVMPPQP